MLCVCVCVCSLACVPPGPVAALSVIASPPSLSEASAPPLEVTNADVR